MKMNHKICAIVAVGSLFIAGSAFAGPPVTITFKNLTPVGGAKADYVITTINESSTNRDASPKPLTSVAAGGI